MTFGGPWSGLFGLSFPRSRPPFLLEKIMTHLYANAIPQDASALAVGLAEAREWGVILGCLILIGVLLFFVFSFARRIMSLYKDALDANVKLSLAIDNLTDKTTQSNERLQEFLTHSFTELGKDLGNIGSTLNIHEKRLDDHETRIGGLETSTSKQTGEI